MRKIVICLLLLVISVCSLSSCDKIKDLTKSKDEIKASSRTEVEIKTSTTLTGNDQLKKSHIGEAILALYKKDYNNALHFAESAKSVDPSNPIILFIIAQIQAANSDASGAVKSIDEALKNGFDNKDMLMNDFYISSLRKSESFKELLKKYNISTKTKGTDKGKTDDEDTIKAGNVEIKMK